MDYTLENAFKFTQYYYDKCLKLYVSSRNDNYVQNTFTSFDTDSSPILVNTGTSFCCNFDRKDFLSYTPHETTIDGMGKRKIIGKVTARWPIITDCGKRIYITIYNCYHLPGVPIKLLSPQTFCSFHRRR